MTPPLKLPRKVILRGVIDFLDWARALGAELYSGGGGSGTIWIDLNRFGPICIDLD